MARHRSAGVQLQRGKRHAPQKSLDNRADRGPVMGSVRHPRCCGRACRHSPRGHWYNFACVPRGLFCAVLHRAGSRPRPEGAYHHNLPIHWLDRYRLARRPCMEFFITTPKALGMPRTRDGASVPERGRCFAKHAAHRWRQYIGRPRHPVPPVGTDLLWHTILVRHRGPGNKEPRRSGASFRGFNIRYAQPGAPVAQHPVTSSTHRPSDAG